MFLHGSGERGDNNLSQLYHVANYLSSDSVQNKYPSLLLFPQCPQNDYWAPIDIVSGQWLTKTSDKPTKVMQILADNKVTMQIMLIIIHHINAINLSDDLNYSYEYNLRGCS